MQVLAGPRIVSRIYTGDGPGRSGNFSRRGFSAIRVRLFTQVAIGRDVGPSLGVARRSDRIPENADGDFFVDRSCIDCDLCRQIAPEVFGRSHLRAQSYVTAQPHDARTQHRALMALITCPTSSIGMTRKLDAKAAAQALPEHVVDDVYFCGWASEDSYGAASWLIVRPDGNVLVDSPRAASTLMSRIEALGGVRYMFLTHRDDVADHAAYHERFGCERIIHRADALAVPEAEHVIAGPDPVRLADDLLIVPVPGHSRGSCVLLHGELCFSGDHVWANDEQTGLEAGPDVCWYSWPEQKRSMARLADHRFTWVLPGHGRRWHAPSPEAMRAELMRLSR
jgi:glyoxylase-like metal-dependent hydrolase (beta-lactamase superfamily II)/ferredoxin